MVEHIYDSVKANARIEPFLSIWGWQIASYLFLGGLVAGIMVFAAVAIVSRREEAVPFTAKRLPLIGFVLLMLGLFMLFLDVERKLMVWRFFLAFEITSPMSWGSWVLLISTPLIVLQVLAFLREGYPPIARLVEELLWIGGLVSWVIDLAYAWRRPIAALTFVFGMILGVYTGILLSAFNARPFWHTALLGPLFLTSGLSTAAALVILLARQDEERHRFTRIDLALIVLELAIIGVWILDMRNGNAMQQQADTHIMGGDYTVMFWVGFIGLGLALPLLLEIFTMRWRLAWVAVLTPVLILGGGYLLRDITLHVGQETKWKHVQNEFNPALMKILTSSTEKSHAE
jgi:formate-dependent nitrite reductase membrane component NrfD